MQKFSDHKKQSNKEKHFNKKSPENLFAYKIFCIYIYVFYSKNAKKTDKIFIEKMLIYERNVHKKNPLFVLIR